MGGSGQRWSTGGHQGEFLSNDRPGVVVSRG